MINEFSEIWFSWVLEVVSLMFINWFCIIEGGRNTDHIDDRKYMLYRHFMCHRCYHASNFHTCINGPFGYTTVCFICFQYSVWDSLKFLLIIFYRLFLSIECLVLSLIPILYLFFFFQAGLVTTLSTRTIVFGATNPKGQYDPDQCITSIELN